ncbi:MAG: acyltransferase [Alphaproteobacteria bacterium]|nr:acyltransferase [Alphaproteobacteria bacterium]
MQSPLLSVQLLRCIAAWLVVIHHYYQIVPYNFNSTIWNWLSVHGKSGVELFFLISGFIIYLSSKNKTILSFWKSRFCRIFPAWWFYLSIFAFLIIYFPSIWGVFHKFEIGHFIKSFLYMRGTHSTVEFPVHSYPLISQGWSLNLEIFFYTIFSLCLFMRNGYRILWCSIFIFFFIFSKMGFIVNLTSIFYSNSSIIVFVFGLLIAYFYENEITSPPLVLVALFLIGMYGLFTFESVGTPRYMSYGLPWTLIFYSVVSLEKYILKFSSFLQWAKHLGDWSYSIYLNHALVLFFSRYLIKQGFISPGLFIFSLSMGTIILLSGLSYYLLEIPSKKIFGKVIDKIAFYISISKRKILKRGLSEAT